MNGSNQDVLLDGRLVHLGVVMDMHGRSEPAVEARTRIFYGSVNGVVGKLLGVCRNENVWMGIMEMSLFPILSYGCHLWDLERTSVARILTRAFRRGSRRGLGLRRSESICDRFENFMKAVERIRIIQLNVLNRTQNSVNSIVSGLRMLSSP